MTTTEVYLVYYAEDGDKVEYSNDLTYAQIAELISTFDGLAEENENE